MRAIFRILLILLAINAQAQLAKGVVIDSVRCMNDGSQTYALYLPSDYSEEKSWPIVIFFEPVARGRLPINLYKKIGEELGVILVCSNWICNKKVDI